MLLVIHVHANEGPCTALVNWLLSNHCKYGIFYVWKKRIIRVPMINSEMCKCHGIGTVKVHTDTRNSADVEVLVVHERPLDFDLLLGYAIKTLDGVLITRMGMVKFCEEAPLCAVLKIYQPDFSVEFDQHQVWTTSWKWSGDREPAKLQNSIAEYHVPSQIRPVYKKELRAWIKNGWLIPYSHEKTKGLIPLMAIV